MGRIYEVQYGDDLKTIADTYQKDIQEIMNFNHIPDARLIYIGQKLYIDEEYPLEYDSNKVTVTGFGIAADPIINPPLTEDFKKQIYLKKFSNYYSNNFYNVTYKDKFVKETTNFNDIKNLKRSDIGAPIYKYWIGTTSDKSMKDSGENIAGQLKEFEKMETNNEINDGSLVQLKRANDSNPFSLYFLYLAIPTDHNTIELKYCVLNSSDGENYFNDYKGPKLLISSKQRDGSKSTITKWNWALNDKNSDISMYNPRIIGTWKWNKENTKNYTIQMQYWKRVIIKDNIEYRNDDAKPTFVNIYNGESKNDSLDLLDEFNKYKINFVSNTEFGWCIGQINLYDEIFYENATLVIKPNPENNEWESDYCNKLEINLSNQIKNKDEGCIENLKPFKPIISIDGYDLKCSFEENIPEIVNNVHFEVIKNNSIDENIYRQGDVLASYLNKGKEWTTKDIDPDSLYKVRCYYYTNDKKSGYSEFSDSAASAPKVPVIVSITPNPTDAANRSATIVWKAANKKTKYTIQYVKKDMDLYGSIENHFWAINSTMTSVEVEFDKTADAQYDTEKQLMTKTIAGLENGYVYYIRMQGINSASALLGSITQQTKSQSATSNWSEIYSFAIGAKPSSPSTWSSTSSAIVNEPLNLYWIQNSEDNSRMTKSKLFLYNLNKKYIVKKEDDSIEAICNNINSGYNYLGSYSYPPDSGSLNAMDKGTIFIISGKEYIVILNDDGTTKSYEYYGEEGDHVVDINNIVKYNSSKNSNLLNSSILCYGKNNNGIIELYTDSDLTNKIIPEENVIYRDKNNINKSYIYNDNLVKGYFKDNKFYNDIDCVEEITDLDTNKTYIDLSTKTTYIYNGLSLKEGLLSYYDYAFKDLLEVGRELYLWCYIIEIDDSDDEKNTPIDNDILYAPILEKKDTVRQVKLKTEYFGEGMKIGWKVQTAGLDKNIYGDPSEIKEINIYAKPEMILRLEDSNHDSLNYLETFPFYIISKKANNTINQKPISFNINIISDMDYETADNIGNIHKVLKGSSVYSKTFDTNLIYSNDEYKFKIEGFLYNGKFYKEYEHINEIVGEINKIYVDLHKDKKTYKWNGIEYIEISELLIINGDKKYPYYYPYYNEPTEELYIKLTCSDLNLEYGIDYIIRCSMVMNSGLIANAEYNFTTVFSEMAYKPNATITIDKNNISALIKPECTYSKPIYEGYFKENKFYRDLECTEEIAGNEDYLFYDILTDNYYAYKLSNNSTDIYEYKEIPNPINDAILSIYRKENDGTFTEIDSNIQNDFGIEIVDPHPSLNYASYRIIAESQTTGLISYNDISPINISEKSIVIQWNDENYSTNNITLKIPYNIDVSNSYSPDVSLVEYIGRKHPVSYYGTHLGESMSWKVEIPKYDIETLNLVRRLAVWMGDVYVREPSGVGYWANITVSFNQNHCDVTIPISFNISRVEGGK